MKVPKVYWTVEGRAIDLEDWVCTDVIGGHDTARGTLREVQARRVEPEALVAAWTDGGVDPIWEGKATEPPLVRDGMADIAAAGHKEEAEKAFGRMLFQTRDVPLLTDRTQPPYNNTSEIAQFFRMTMNPGQLLWDWSAHTLTQNQFRSAALWVPGAALTRYAWTTQDLGSGGNAGWRVRVFRFPGSSDTGFTQVADHAVATMGVVDQAVTSPQPGLLFQFIWTGANGTGAGAGWLGLRDLRVNGIAPGDTFYTWQVIGYIAGLLGWDTSGVLRQGANALPLDVVDDSWAGVLHDMDLLDDQAHFVSCRDRTSGLVKISRGAWTDVTWDTHQDGWCETDIAPLRPIDGVVVSYDDVGGAPRQVTAGATSGHLYRESLADVQPNGNLATTLANTLWAQAQGERFDGGSRIFGARRQDGLAEDIFRIRPGQQYRIADYGPSKDVILRVHRVERSQRGGVSVDTSREISPARILALAELEAARAPSTAGGPPTESADSGWEESHEKFHRRNRRRRKGRKKRHKKWHESHPQPH